MIEILHYLNDPIDYGNYGIFLIMGNAYIINSSYQWGIFTQTTNH